MIGWGDVYRVVAAMAPLYFALGLGYGSVRWLKLFTPDQCEAINRAGLYFAFPFFSFDFTARAGTFASGYRVLAADAFSKLAVVLTLSFSASAKAARQARGGGGGATYSWCITGFSLAALNNALLVGVPLLDAMYGKWARDIVVQLSVLQSVVWVPLMLVVFEARQAWLERTPTPSPEEGDRHVEPESGNVERPAASGADLKTATATVTGCAFWAPLLRTVGLKVARNPNVYASLLGVAWSSVANRWHLKIPGILDGSINIMSKTCIGLGMFSMGLFIGLQDKFIVCGPGLTILSMVLRFVAAPATTAVGALVFGLRGDLLCVAILQAALPPSVATFSFAREYNLHADVLSTAIVVGTLASLPVLTTYYVALGFVK